MALANLRPELLHHLEQRVTAFQDGFRQNLALIGPPGSGKTYQLRQLVAARATSRTVIYCPLYQESCAGVLRRFVAAIVQSVVRQEEGADLASLLEAAASRWPKTASAMRTVDELIARRSYAEAFRRIFDGLQVLTAEQGRPCVLILDEFLFLEEAGLTHAFQELGKRVMTCPSILFMLASSSAVRARVILRERLHLLFGQFELIEMAPLEGQRAHDWVQQELRGVPGGKELGPFAIQWIGGSPWHLTVLLDRLKELAALRRGSGSTEQLMTQAAWDLIGRSTGALHQWCAGRTQPLSVRDVDVLLQVALGARTATRIGARAGRQRLSATLQRLVEEDLAQRNGTCWIVPDPLLRCWLSTVLWTQRERAVPDRRLTRERVEQYLGDLWLQWVWKRQRPLADQVSNLLSRFCDETLSLDQKTGRLPQFERIHVEGQRADGETYLVAEARDRRWCCSVAESPVSESAVAAFETFCRTQRARPARKIVVAAAGLDANAKLMAKAANMWVWGAGELEVLSVLYGHATSAKSSRAA